MLFSKVRDLNLRANFAKKEHFRRVNKFVKINLLTKRFNVKKQQSKKKRKKKVYLLKAILAEKSARCSKIRLVKRCLLTNRSKSVLSPYNLGRNILRDLLQFGIIPGYKKAVW